MSNLKGIWIPESVLALTNISPAQQMLLSYIISLSENENGKCFATNQHFSEVFHKAVPNISRDLSELVQKEYISTEVIREKGNQRLITPIIKLIIPYYQNDNTPYYQNDNTYYQNDNTPIIKLIIPTIYDKIDNDILNTSDTTHEETFVIEPTEETPPPPQTPPPPVLPLKPKKEKAKKREVAPEIPFTDSDLATPEAFALAFEGTTYQQADLNYYFECVLAWRDKVTGKPPLRKDWKATASRFMLNDYKDHKLKLKTDKRNANPTHQNQPQQSQSIDDMFSKFYGS